MNQAAEQIRVCNTLRITLMTLRITPQLQITEEHVENV